MGKLLRLGVLAGIVGGAVFAWKRLTGGSRGYGDAAEGDENSESSRQGGESGARQRGG